MKRIDIVKTQNEDGSTSYSYPVDMSAVKNLMYAPDRSYAVGEIDADLPDATDADIAGLKDLETAKTEARELLIWVCNNKFEQLKNGYPERETQSWGVQLAEANAYLADETSPTPFINAALREGETVAEYSQLIVANNAQWSTYAGGVVKLRRDYERAIDSATTSVEVELIVDQIKSL